MIEILLIVGVVIAGGSLPLVVRWTDRFLHAALAAATGVFLGAVFLHLLPSLSRYAPAGSGEAPGGYGDTAVWLCVLAGVLAVYFIETVLFRASGPGGVDRHLGVGYAALAGLSIHSVANGVGYAAAADRPELAGPLLVAIVAHKGFESFSLASVFRLAGFTARRVFATVVAFSLATPAGILLGNALATLLGDGGLAIVTALAAGTFLYVCLCELLPEVFHHREDGVRKILLLLAGIGAMLVVHVLGA